MELLEIVDKNGNTLSLAPRSDIHGNPALLHKRDELDDVKFWQQDEIRSALGKDILSDNFESEILRST